MTTTRPINVSWEPSPVVGAPRRPGLALDASATSWQRADSTGSTGRRGNGTFVER